MTETMPAAGGAPIPAGHLPGWSEERLEAAKFSSYVLTTLLEEVASCITTAHGHGLAVPSKATEGYAALLALAQAWADNSHGQPIDAGTRAALGL
jgi:hypothetical protein